MNKVHHLKAESIESLSEVSTPNISEIVEKIQLTDKVSEGEKTQMLRWVKERVEEIWASIKDISDIIELVQNELSGLLSNDALQILIDILSKYL